MRATTQKGYEQKIRARMKQVQTYRPEFGLTIERLAEAYMRRDMVKAKLEEHGYDLLIQVENSEGEPRLIRNAYLVELENLDRQTLTMERELGLTPAALKRINEDAMKKKAESDPLAEIMAGLKVV